MEAPRTTTTTLLSPPPQQPQSKLPRLTPRIATKIERIEAETARRRALLGNREGRRTSTVLMYLEIEAMRGAVNARLDVAEYVKKRGFLSQL